MNVKIPPVPLTSNAPESASAEGETLQEIHAENTALRARVAELEVRQQLLTEIIEACPNMIYAKDAEGRYLLINAFAARTLRRMPADILGLRDDQLFPAAEVPAIRAKDLAVMASGDAIRYDEQVRTDEKAYQFLTIKFPIRDAQGQVSGLAGITTDITDRKEEEAKRVALQQQVIDAQQAALRELSTPIVPIADGVLAMPLVGVIDSVRAAQIMETLLDGISSQGAKTAILDITGVRVVDTAVADALMRAARAARLIGAEVLLTGIRPEVARTLVELGPTMGDVVTLGTLQGGVAYALQRARSTAPAGVR